MGATVHLHYCMDKLVNWDFGHEQSAGKSCDYCGMAKSKTDKHCVKETKGCCKDEQKVIKLANDQKKSETYSHSINTSTEAITPLFNTSLPEYDTSLSEEFPPTHAPPPAQNCPLYLLNCIFRI